MADIRCKATSRRTGQRCQQWAMHGQLVCYHHGGAAPQNKAAGAKRVAEQQLQDRAIATLKDVAGFTSVGDVYTELLEVAAVNRQFRLILQQRVSHLSNLSYAGLESGEQIKGDVQLLERALERSARTGEALARLNLEERKQALDERVAGALVRCIQLVLNDLDLTAEQHEVAAKVIPKRLRELSA